MNEPTVNMQDFILHSLRAAAIALKHISAQRDEARAVARRLYIENIRLSQENKDYVREYHFAFLNWQEYAQRCQDYEAENARLRARLQELEGEQEPGP